jgi:hypothetical protein
MLKRIAIVAFFTGSGQLLSVFVLKFISQYAEVEQLKNIAEIDSLVFFIMNVVALGLQSAAMRNLAQGADWQQEYHDTQSARITLGLLLMAGALLFFINKYYLVFMIAPLFAWNGDYALYAKGYPITGAVISFVRLTMPFTALLVAAYFKVASLDWLYVIAVAAVYIITNAYISYFLRTAYFFKPSVKSLHLYVQSLPLGVVALSLYFLGIGLLLIIPYFYISATIIAVSFLGLKFYIIFKGVLRILHQAFFSELTSRAVSLRVDQLSILAGLLLLGSTAIFPSSFITLFFGSQYVQESLFFIIIGINALVYSVFLSFATRAMLQKEDKRYTMITLAAAMVTLVAVIVMSFFRQDVTNIAISLLAGELTWSIGLVWLIGTGKEVKDRLLFIAAILPLLAIPVAARYWMGDSLYCYLASFGLLCIVLLILQHRKLKTLTNTIHTKQYS